MVYLNHLNSAGFFEQAGESRAVDIERQITDEDFEVRRGRAFFFFFGVIVNILV